MDSTRQRRRRQGIRGSFRRRVSNSKQGTEVKIETEPARRVGPEEPGLWPRSRVLGIPRWSTRVVKRPAGSQLHCIEWAGGQGWEGCGQIL